MNILLAYYSGYGHTKKVADCIAEGAQNVTGCNVNLLNVENFSLTQQQLLEEADAIVFGSPTYMGSIAAKFKIFLEQLAGDIWVNQLLADKIAAGFTVGTYPSGDKASTLYQLSIFAAQHGMIWVGNNLVGSRITGDSSMLNHDGAWHGLSTSSSSDKSQLIDYHYKETAMLFGKRIALACKRWSM